MAFTKLAFYLACIMTTLAMAGIARAQNSPDDFVNAHNSARSNVGVGPVTWDNVVAAYAVNYALQRSSDCALISSNSATYGENLAAGSGADYTAEDAVALWVSENQYYDYNTNSCAYGKFCGYYTQVVWKNTTRIGCARLICNNGVIFMNCNYFPAGNVIGERPY
ncbi:hypothetical protein J5N97_003091 [Dioscorea zingiberensis]|uniref:SCP domain-containing protein n=1 Tax=Dioscorea zingiberensis TaxID=325984 RepID=A0A9D5HPS0_9LILI|nr:hypothetical protein J5N97_003091 [Dioscorea zingiberensis]